MGYQQPLMWHCGEFCRRSLPYLGRSVGHSRLLTIPPTTIKIHNKANLRRGLGEQNNVTREKMNTGHCYTLR
jgi:hypothetical protein